MGDEWNEIGYVENPNELLGDKFISEKEMCNFIDRYAYDFCKDVLEIEYKSHTREYYLGDRVMPARNGNKPHIDFIFQGVNGENILLECKNPTNVYAELSNSIGQILSYYCIAKFNGIKIDRLIVITGRYNDKIRQVITEFKLPIEIYLMSKTNILKVLR